jgi:cobyrinic acid a,c-diamide synthase
MTTSAIPRVVVAGLSGDAGKTLAALAIVTAARDRGMHVRGFKKGPDYIDAAWLSWASQAPARNLDTFLAGPEGALLGFLRHAVRPDGAVRAVNVIEGNRGLFDGTDAIGTHSTAVLARLLRAPVVLVINLRKMTATAAALVRGCQAMEPALTVAGVILNQVAGRRHEAVAREAIEQTCHVPVLGAIPRLDDPGLLPGRHLGLVPPAEHGGPDDAAGSLELLRRIAREYLDVDRLLECAEAAPAIDDLAVSSDAPDTPARVLRPVTIGFVSDSAFSFYYPENLEALEARGATLVPLSSLSDGALPAGLSALYLGGGFPETHAESIAGNRRFLDAIGHAAARGLPIYAECGGLILLANSVQWRGRRHAMAGVLPVDVDVLASPQGHGYAVLRVDRLNPFFAVGDEIRGHEFHYSRIAGPLPGTACAVVRGTGCGEGRDAIVANGVWASYVHVHAAGVPAWADGMIRAACAYSINAGDTR